MNMDERLGLLTPSSETFTSDEARLLTPFFTNTTRSVVALRNLPEVTKGALFSRYSRTAKGVRRLFLDEFYAQSDAAMQPAAAPVAEDESSLRKAEAFYARVLSDYGDDSVGELGGAHIAFQDISQIAAKSIEDSRIGVAYLEKSTRYVRFDDKVDGRYKYYRDRRILASRFGDAFVVCMDRLFDDYARSFPLMTAHIEQQHPIADIVFENVLDGQTQRFADIQDDEFKKSAQFAYNQAVRARACDSLRCFLPLASLTNVGVYANGRSHEYVLTKLFADPLHEMNTLAYAANHELEQVIGPFIRRAVSERGLAHQEYLRHRREAQMHWAKAVQPAPLTTAPCKVTLLRYDDDALDSVAAAIIFPYSDYSESDLLQTVAGLSLEAKERIVADYVGQRTNRRHKPGRAFERANYTFELCLNIGEYRDLQRHRVCTPARQQFTTAIGYDVNPDVAAVPPVRAMYEQNMARAHDLFGRMAGEMPAEAQYAVPMGYRVRYTMQMNLREAFHLIELRSGEQGHRDYRHTAQQMYEAIKSVHPELARGMTFVNMTPDIPMGRLRAEMRSARRRSAGERG
jgi:thymidylate synthase ThyX